MSLFIQEWSIVEKTSFPNQILTDSKTRKEGEELLKKRFLESDRTPHLLYYPRKGIEESDLNSTLLLLLERKELPSCMNELFDGWFNFRIIDKQKKTCDCAQFFKSNYCKHIVALKIINGELSDPEIKKNKNSEENLK